MVLNGVKRKGTPLYHLPNKTILYNSLLLNVYFNWKINMPLPDTCIAS
jgi:hypothetical protein